METLDSFRRNSALCCAVHDLSFTWPDWVFIVVLSARQNKVTRNSVGDHSGTIVNIIFLLQDSRVVDGLVFAKKQPSVVAQVIVN